MAKLSIFRPPSRYFLPASLIFFALCFVLHPQSAIMHGRFIDPDDTMYAVQSAELLDGQGWYDRAEHRMNPPAGVTLHFARLLELPYAATIGALTPFVGRVNSIFVTAAIWPPFFLFVLLLVYRKQARLFLPKKWGALTALICMLAQQLLFDYMPGHIDHHGFVLLLVNLCMAFILLMIANPRSIKPAVAAGVTLAFALSIALETLPWLLVFSAFIGVCSTLNTERTKSALAFGISLFLTGVLLLPTYRAPAEYFTMDISAFSSVYIILLFAIALCLGATWLVRKEPDKNMRVALVGIGSFFIGSIFLCTFPQLLQGPYGAADEQLMDFLLPNIIEAKPLYNCMGIIELSICFLPWPLLSLGACIWQIRSHQYRLRQMWLFITLLQTISLVLTVFYESRYLPYTESFGVIPLTFLLWRMLRGASTIRAVFYVVTAFFYPIGTMAFYYHMPPISAIFYPMISYTPTCDLNAAASVLNQPPFNTGAPKLILSQMNEGPDLLLETRHTILSAPFHENVSGNLDVLDFFRASDPQEAKKIAQARNIDFVLFCRHVVNGYFLANPLSPSTALPHPFIRSLIGGDIPNWLTPIAINEPNEIFLYRVTLQDGASKQ